MSRRIPQPSAAALALILLSAFFVTPGHAQDTTVLPSGEVGEPYSVSIGVDTVNGKGPFAFKLAQGELPPGLQLTAAGSLAGTPTGTKADAYLFELTVSDSSQPPQSATLGFSIAIASAPLRIKAIKVATPQLKIRAVSASVAPSNAPASSGPNPNLPDSVPSAEMPSSPASHTVAGLSATPAGPNPTPPQATAAPAAPVPAPAPAPGPATNPPSDCKSTTKPYVLGSPVEALKVVTGCGGGVNAVQVAVLESSHAGSCPATDPTQAAKITKAGVDLKTGVFHVELKEPVATDQVICLWPIKADNTLDAPGSPVLVAARTYEESDSPHGRIRYYLSAGVSLSQENQQFSKQNLVLGFNLDKNWWRHNWMRGGGIVVNSYFDAQLTSIPVAASCQSVTTTSTGSASSASCPQGTSNDLQTFMTSRKAAVVQGGLYLPMYANAWKWWYGGNQNEIFIAPIIKGGYQTLTDGTQSISSPTPGVTTTTATLQNQNLFPFYAYGIRLGHFTDYSSWNIAPELNSYLDLTIGRWNNFVQCQGGTCGVNTKQFFQPTTLDFEGHLKVPKTPFELGFSTFSPINGKNLLGDLRFYFGMRLDMGCIMSKVIAGQNTTFSGCPASQP